MTKHDANMSVKHTNLQLLGKKEETYFCDIIGDSKANWMLATRFCGTDDRQELPQGAKLWSYIYVSFCHHQFTMGQSTSFVKHYGFHLNVLRKAMNWRYNLIWSQSLIPTTYNNKITIQLQYLFKIKYTILPLLLLLLSSFFKNHLR